MSTTTDGVTAECATPINNVLSFYDVLIVGAGLIGSSAARHASKLMAKNGRSRLNVCLVGPREPKSRPNNTIFGAHYDEGRITRVAAPDEVWSVLARKSIDRYRALESETGIQFYNEVGCLAIGDRSSDFISASLRTLANTENRRVIHLTKSALLSTFPYVGVTEIAANSNGTGATDGNLDSSSEGLSAIWEQVDAGWINPRRLCAAQQAAALKAGCHLVRDVVSDVIGDGADSLPITVKTDGGLTLRVGKVLIATGAFTEFRRLIPPSIRLDLTHLTQSVVFVEIGRSDLDRMRAMPSMIVHSSRPYKAEKSQDQYEDKVDCYILPPITYPNGKTYVKLGHGSQFELLLKSPEEIINWYRSPVPEGIRNGLLQIFHIVFPNVRPLSIDYDNCVTTHTPSRRPYIDLLTTSFGVALGGNGYAAKSSDEIGRLAAELLVNGSWSSELPRDQFRAARLNSVSKL